MGMGQASAWGMARLRPLEDRWKVVAVLHSSGACSHSRPDLIILVRLVVKLGAELVVVIHVLEWWLDNEWSLLR